MSRRVRTTAIGLAALAAAVAPAAASAQAPPPPGSKSANVTALTTLPEPNGISANFHGSVMCSKDAAPPTLAERTSEMPEVIAPATGIDRRARRQALGPDV